MAYYNSPCESGENALENNPIDWFLERSRFLKGSVALGVLVFVGLIIFRALWVTSIDNYELGFVFNRSTGKIQTIDRKGWVIYTPIKYSVHTIDLRPYQVSISANSRILNAKLVRFNPDGLDTFVEWHGRDAGDLTPNLLEILKSYAFATDGGKNCPFLTVVSELSGLSSTPMTNVVEKENNK